MRKVAAVIACASFLLTTTAPAWAENATPSARATARQAVRETAQATRETNLKNRAEGEINRRVEALQRGITKLDTLKRLTADEKAPFITAIQNEITSLTDLKTKIDADTDFMTLRSDVQSIIKSFRVYALFIPKMHILVAADRLTETADRLAVLAGKLQTRITQAQSSGKEVTAMQASLTDMQAKIADARTQATNAENAVLPLTPTGYPGNQINIGQARRLLEAGRKDLVTAYQDAKSIIQTLRSLSPKPTGKSASESAGTP